MPFTIVRATQFFEFLGGIAESRRRATPFGSRPLHQPIAADDLAAALADIAFAAPLNATIEIAGPEKTSIAEFVRRFLAESGDTRTVVADPKALYYGG